MNSPRTICIVFILSFFTGCIFPQSNPEVLFSKLEKSYLKSEVENRNVDNMRSEGASLEVFDIGGKISTDSYYRLNLYSSSGQTQYFCYQKSNSDIWIVHKKAMFYQEPFKVEGADIENSYFLLENGRVRTYNKKNGLFDIEKDTDDFSAVVDLRSIRSVIDIVQRYGIKPALK